MGARQHVLAAVVLAGLVLSVLFEALFGQASLLSVDLRLFPPFPHHVRGDETPTAMNLTCLDASAWLVPEQMVQAARLAAGELPLWNPHECLGQPQLAMLGHGPFYPTVVLDLVLDPLRAYAVSMALHLLLLGLGTWWLQRRCGLEAAGALLGAITMMLSAYVSVHLHAPLIVRAIAWLPWVALSACRLVEQPGRTRSAILASTLGGSLLAGFPQIALLGGCAVGAALIVPLVRAEAARRRAALAWGLLSITLGAALGAVQLVPALELRDHSWRRGGWPAEVMAAKSLDPQTLLGYALPCVFGSPIQVIDVTAPRPRSVWDFPSYRAWQTQEVQNNFEENALYIGIVPLVLVLCACLRRGRPWGWLAALALVLALALGVPLLSHLAGLLPGFRAGSPKRILFLAAFAMAWIAAGQASRMLAAPGAGSGRALTLAGGVCLALGLAGLLLPHGRWLFPAAGAEDQLWFEQTLAHDFTALLVGGAGLVSGGLCLGQGRARLAVALLIGATSAELVTFARHVNPALPITDHYAETPGIAWLRERGAGRDHRILSFDTSEVLPGSIAQLFGLRSVNGLASLLVRQPGELLAALEPGVLALDNPCLLGALREPRSLQAPLLDLLGVRFVVTGVHGHELLQAWREQLPGLELAYASEREAMAIYERRGALGPAFAVSRLRSMPAAEDRLAYLASADFRPAQEAIVEEPDLAPSGELGPAEVTSSRPSPERIELTVVSEGPAFVVVSETCFPGWRATLAGEGVPIHRVDHALMGLVIPAGGTHELVLDYAPASFTRGWLLSTSALVVVLVLLARRQAGRCSGDRVRAS